MERKHNHYFKDVRDIDHIDVYRVLLAFQVTDPCIQHAVKKLLVAGGRGAGKDITRDIKEAIDSLERWNEMRAEEAAAKLLDEDDDGETAFNIGMSIARAARKVSDGIKAGFNEPRYATGGMIPPFKEGEAPLFGEQASEFPIPPGTRCINVFGSKECNYKGPKEQCGRTFADCVAMGNKKNFLAFMHGDGSGHTD